MRGEAGQDAVRFRRCWALLGMAGSGAAGQALAQVCNGVAWLGRAQVSKGVDSPGAQRIGMVRLGFSGEI